VSNRTPLVSVIVCVFNGERFLAEALESVLTQDYEPIELIVVDDGSTDRSGKIARSFQGVKFVPQENSGIPSARNRGLEVAAGDFVTFLDADDVMHAEKIGAQVRYLEQNAQVGYVLCRQEIFLETGLEAPSWLTADRVFGDLGGIPPTAGLIRRKALLAVGGFDPSYRVGEGMEWLGRMREAEIEIAVLPKVLLRRRIHEANLTHSNRELIRGLIRGLKGKIERARAEEG
jgi:glycosyltransferase involved in cell wall biosynthesis